MLRISTNHQFLMRFSASVCLSVSAVSPFYLQVSILFLDIDLALPFPISEQFAGSIFLPHVFLFHTGFPPGHTELVFCCTSYCIPVILSLSCYEKFNFSHLTNCYGVLSRSVSITVLLVLFAVSCFETVISSSMSSSSSPQTIINTAVMIFIINNDFIITISSNGSGSSACCSCPNLLVYWYS